MTATRARIRELVSEALRARLDASGAAPSRLENPARPRGNPGARARASVPGRGISPPESAAPLDLVCADDVPDGGILLLTADAKITPLARDLARDRGVEFKTAAPSEPAALEMAVAAPPAVVVGLGSDHGGFALKEILREFLETEAGYRVIDYGTHSEEAVDYPDIAHLVAAAVERGEVQRAVLVDGMGLGSAMAANRHPGVRAATVREILEAVNAREHNDANLLCLGGRVVGDLLAKALVMVFLTTDFAGGRHARRVDKI